MQNVARDLVTSPDGVFHVGRDGILRSFSRDLEVLDAAPLKREVILASRDVDASVDAFSVSARDMFRPADDIVNEIRAIRARAAEEETRDAEGLQARSCGGYCTSHGSCALNEEACQGCYNDQCGR